MMKVFHLLSGILVGVSLAFGEPSSPTSGQPGSVSTHYRADHGTNALISSVASSATYQNRAGYVGQLTDVVSFATYPDPAVVTREGSDVPLVVASENDDGSTSRLTTGPGEVTFTILTGPISAINAVPAASLGLVFEDSLATYRASFQGLTADGEILVLNTNRDDFGSYAGDGVADEWQVDFFGLDNPLAGPLADPDGDGQENRNEFLSGYDPTDPSEKLTFEILGVASGVSSLRFSKVISTTRYEVEQSIDLAQAVPWSSASIFVPLADESDFVLPVSSPSLRNFFRLRLDSVTPLEGP